MRKLLNLLGGSLLAITIAWSPAAHTLRVENFLLLDQTGRAHELYYYSDASAVVIMVQGNGCPVVEAVALVNLYSGGETSEVICSK